MVRAGSPAAFTARLTKFRRFGRHRATTRIGLGAASHGHDGGSLHANEGAAGNRKRYSVLPGDHGGCVGWIDWEDVSYVRVDIVTLWATDVVELFSRLEEVLVRLVGLVAHRLVLTKEGAGGLYRVEHNGRRVFPVSDGA